MKGNSQARPPLYTGDDSLSIHDDDVDDLQHPGIKPQMESRSTGRCNWTSFLIALLSIATLLFILLLIGLGIWYFLFLQMNGDDDELVVININVTFDRQYTPYYTNSSSRQYRELEKEFITTMDELLGNNELYKDSYEETTVSRIRPGSVEIVSWVLFLNSIGDSFNINTELRQSLLDTLSEVVDDNFGRLPGLDGSVLKLRVSYPIDPDARPTRDPPTEPDCNGFLCNSGECFPADFECDFETDCSDTSDEHDQCPDCSEVGFECNNGQQCIPSKWVCDYEDDCIDGSDEHSGCPNCYDVGFVCNNGQCISADWECNYEVDCLDLSDEHAGCPAPETCTEVSEYRCEYGSLFCIDDSLVCNGDVDCPDGDDEDKCQDDCNGFQCDSGECFPADWECDFEADCEDSSDEHDQCPACSEVGFLCNNGQQCILSIWECDYLEDCDDGSDEHSQCPSCYDVGFVCNSGQCITANYECDYEVDCLDGSDEHAGCPDPEPCAEVSEYRCEYGSLFCIDDSLVCNGDVDCPGGDDEDKCQDDCNGFQCGSGECFPADWECDFEADCEDSSDEHDQCPACSQVGFICTNGQQCIPSIWECDYEEDCDDGSDEHGRCPECNDVGFVCDNGDCIPAEWECNYDVNCLDGSDEHEDCPAPETCAEVSEYRCEYGTLFCIDDSLVCNGDIDCPGGDDEEYCPDECGDSPVFLRPDESYELTSLNYPYQYPNDAYCQWIFSVQAGRQLLLQFSQFSLEDSFDFLYISLDGENYDNLLTFTGSETPPDLLSRGSEVVILMTTDESTTDFGFVLQISDTEGDDSFVCEDYETVPAGSLCNGYMDCLDNSDEAPCQCGDIGPDIYLQDTNDQIQLTSFNYPYEYTNSLDCFWTVRASLGYRVFLRFKDFSLEYGADYLSITGSEAFDPVVSYTGQIRPPDIESPSDFLYIGFETDFSTGDSGFLAVISQIRPLDKQKCDNDLELYPDNGGVCDGIQHCYDNSDEPDGCECGQDEYFLLPGTEPITLYSTNYPLEYQDNTRCVYSINTTPGYRILVKTLQLNLEDGFDFIYFEAGETLETTLTYTGTSDRNELDVVSVDNKMAIYFETDESFTDTGFVLQITSIPSDFDDDRVVCDNDVQLIPREYFCDAIEDCEDGSDEIGCVDIFDTEICGTRPVVDNLRIFNGEEADDGDFPWLGQLLYDFNCGAALINEYWAITAAHCVVDLGGYNGDISVAFGDLSRTPDNPNRQEVKAAFYIQHPGYPILVSNGVNIGDDLALIRFESPVKFTDYVRPICISASMDEPNDYQQCRIAGWGRANHQGSSSSDAYYSFYRPQLLRTASVPLFNLEECYEQWLSTTVSSSFGVSSEGIWLDEGVLLCAGVVVDDPSDVVDVCAGDSGTPLVCLGKGDIWHMVGIVSFGDGSCRSTKRAGVYTRVSAYRDYIIDVVETTDACLSSDDPTCVDYIECAGGTLCNMNPCDPSEFQCITRQCINPERVCDGVDDCSDGSDEEACSSDECGDTDVYLSHGDTYNLASPNHPDYYPNDTLCEWTVTAPPGSRIRAVFDVLEFEDEYDFVYVGYEPLRLTDGGRPRHRLTGDNLASFISPSNSLYIGMTSDETITFSGFSMTLSLFPDYGDLPPLCNDNFQVFAGDSAVCDGVEDCLDNTDEAPCVTTECPSIEYLEIGFESSIDLTSPGYPSGYLNSLSCTWLVTAPQDRHIVVTIIDFQLDVETDALHISSESGDEGVLTYRSEADGPTPGQRALYFQSNQIIVQFQSDAFFGGGKYLLDIRDTSGDDCVFSTNPNCVDRPECDINCYIDFCASGVEFYPVTWFCDGEADCSDFSDEQESCECGERDIEILPGGNYELSPPISLLFAPAYLESSDCQWVITTSPGNVLFAHFDVFDIEDASQYPSVDGFIFGDYLYVGTGSTLQSSRLISYTGSDTPLDIETPSNSLVFTFVTDTSVAYDGFTVIIYSRQPSAVWKCANGLEILPTPSDEATCNR